MVTDVKLQKLDCWLDIDQDPEQWYCTIRGAVVSTNEPVGYDMSFETDATVTDSLNDLEADEEVNFV